jgi:putative phosphoribosyl transferase
MKAHPMANRLRNRTEAGQLLAKHLQAYANCPDVLLLALPRGGVPVGFEIAKRLNAPMDVFIVRKLGVPGQPELAMGAIAPGGIRSINQDIINEFHISAEAIDAAVHLERPELDRRDQLYRGTRPPADVKDRTVILVDDGVATGASMRVAIDTIQQQGPEYLIVAVPVAPLSTYEALKRTVDEVACLIIGEPFYSLGLWYDDFTQVSDAQVRELLEQSPNLPLIQQFS